MIIEPSAEADAPPPEAPSIFCIEANANPPPPPPAPPLFGLFVPPPPP